MPHIKIVEKTQERPTFIIQEIISNDGLYITWLGLFESKKSAKKEIENILQVKLNDEQWRNLDYLGADI